MIVNRLMELIVIYDPLDKEESKHKQLQSRGLQITWITPLGDSNPQLLCNGLIEFKFVTQFSKHN
jgi:hypothetical protein